MLNKLAERPRYPYSPFYAPWEHLLHLQMELLRQQAEVDRQIRHLGLQETWRGWAISAPRPSQSQPT
ncbi:MAG: hypothetical protein EOO62_08130 [Hymenobacter sp.]|nr:MAG: hypothetical protein EOO62_08130 [Hymenobacter sp.]